jgi:hypothetical protein
MKLQINPTLLKVKRIRHITERQKGKLRTFCITNVPEANKFLTLGDPIMTRAKEMQAKGGK